MPIAQVNGQGIYYEDTGNADKPAIVMMHGFLFDQSMFDPQVEALKEAYRCVRFDARALGQTQWDGEPFTLYDTVADCLGLMDYLEIDKATIIGMSQGGYAAVRLGLNHLDRLDAIIFMSTHHLVDDDSFKSTYRSVRDAWREADAPPEMILNNMLTLLLGAPEETAELWQIWRPKWQAVKGEQAYHGMNNLLERDEIPDEKLSAITVPTLVIHGKEDRGLPITLGERLYRALPNAKGMVAINGAAHAANLYDPQTTNTAIQQFLSTHVYPTT